MTAPGQRPYRVLIVDDLPHERIAIRAAIEEAVAGCEFAEADGVAAAERILREEAFPFDLAVIDLRLVDDAEGLTVLDIIKQAPRRHSQTRVIILTAFPSVETACGAYEAGASTYLDKRDADSTRKLQEKARQLLELRDLRRSVRRQYESQQAAEAALRDNRDEWTRTYGGKFVLVRAGRVLLARDHPHDLLEALEEYGARERSEMGIVEVPQRKETDAEG